MRLIDADELNVRISEDKFWNYGYAMIMIMVNESPTVEPVKHGFWVFADEYSEIGKVMDVLVKNGIDPLDAWTDTIYCSCCGYGFNCSDNCDTDRFDYCPHCGAKMDEVETSYYDVKEIKGESK